MKIRSGCEAKGVAVMPSTAAAAIAFASGQAHAWPKIVATYALAPMAPGSARSTSRLMTY